MGRFSDVLIDYDFRTMQNLARAPQSRSDSGQPPKVDEAASHDRSIEKQTAKSVTSIASDPTTSIGYGLNVINAFYALRFAFPKHERDTFLDPLINDLKADFLEGIEDADTRFERGVLVASLGVQVVVQIIQVIGLKLSGLAVAAAVGAWKFLVG